jgi:hypothetical protein
MSGGLATTYPGLSAEDTHRIGGRVWLMIVRNLLRPTHMLGCPLSTEIDDKRMHERVSRLLQA